MYVFLIRNTKHLLQKYSISETPSTYIESFDFWKVICSWSFLEKYQTKFFDLTSYLMAPLRWHISVMFVLNRATWSSGDIDLN